MKKVFLLVFIAFMTLVGCYKTEYSPTMTEKGKVLDLFFTPKEVTHTNVVHTDSDGFTHFNTYTNEVPAKYSVIYQCEHGTRFVITGSDVLHQELYKRMVKDSNVTIFYREVYSVDKKKSIKKLRDYDFLDAKIGG